MKKLMCLCLSLVLLCTLCAPALAESDDHVIRVTGNATITLAPDTASLRIGVTTRSSTIQEAQAENARLMDAVIAAILGLGVAEKDVITSEFNVYSNFETAYDAQGKEITKPYYEVWNMLNVTVRDLSLVGAVLDTAMAAGANTSYGISFSSTKANEAYQKALVRAVEDAQMKAQVLADAAGKTLDELLSMDASQGSFYGDYGASNVFAADAATADTSIVSGDVSVSASVVLEYSFD